jgi:2-iminoacetate synthase
MNQPESFSQSWDQQRWCNLAEPVEQATPALVEQALLKSRLTIQDFAALISPHASDYLEPMAIKAQHMTRQRFGHVVQSYAPLYLSNVCSNWCSYCGFSIHNKLKRKTLNKDEIKAEAKALKQRGFDHVLLVTGEAEKTVGADYIEQAVKLIKPMFSQVSIEVQPLECHEYRQLRNAGVEGISLYQETYNPQSYAQHHRKGKKQNMPYRLDAPERAGDADIRKINLGILIGLSNWRQDSLACALHLRYLQKKYWKARFGMSFPRLRPCTGELENPLHINDRDFLQLILAWRLFDAELDLSLSTRESPAFRDGISHLGITSMSAESITQPGGYADNVDAQLEQFAINDDRKLTEVKEALAQRQLMLIATDSHYFG